MESLRLRAYGKINIGLFVYGIRDDGYHEIETIFYCVNIYDVITLRETKEEGIRFISTGREIPTEGNLCVKAANAFREHTSIERGLEITLEKQIPIGAGLGGGSSDAAAVIRGLAALWNVSDADLLHTIAATVGADVPYFLHPGMAYATGRGEILHSIDLALPYWILIASPPIRISSAWAYEHVRIRPGKPTGELLHAAMALPVNPTALFSIAKNDFQPLVFATHSEIAAIAKTLLATRPVFASLTGSGSALYALFHSEESTLKAKNAVEKRFPSAETFVTPPNFSATDS